MYYFAHDCNRPGHKDIYIKFARPDGGNTIMRWAQTHYGQRQAQWIPLVMADYFSGGKRSLHEGGWFRTGDQSRRRDDFTPVRSILLHPTCRAWGRLNLTRSRCIGWLTMATTSWWSRLSLTLRIRRLLSSVWRNTLKRRAKNVCQ